MVCTSVFFPNDTMRCRKLILVINAKTQNKLQRINFRLPQLDRQKTTTTTTAAAAAAATTTTTGAYFAGLLRRENKLDSNELTSFLCDQKNVFL